MHTNLISRWTTRFIAALMIALLALAAMPVRPAYAATITVNITTDENIANGDCSLREAIIAANNDIAYGGCSAGSGADTIILTSGSTYTLTLIAGGTGDLDVTSDITIQASDAALVIIDPDTAAGFNERVLDVTNTGMLTLDTIRITSASQGVGMGGAILNQGGAVTIRNSMIDNNEVTAAFDGGAYYQNGGSLTVIDSTFYNNSATDDDGGALYQTGSGTITISDSTFYGNRANVGGAIRTAGGTVMITNSTLNENVASAVGGAIYTSNSTTMTITNSTFYRNTAGLGGGGLSGRLMERPISLSRHFPITRPQGGTAAMST